MKIIRVNNQVEGGQVAFSLLKDEMAKGAKTLGLATGSTPLSFYEEIRKSNLDFSDMTSINLDEYVGLAADNEQSLSSFYARKSFPIQTNLKKVFFLTAWQKICKQKHVVYDQVIAEHGIDFQILGIGRDVILV